MTRILVTMLGALLFTAVKLHGQCVPVISPSTECETAPLLCFDQLCFYTTNIPFNCCNGWCGANTAIHNPQYFAFIPSETEVVIHISVDSCNSGVGLQSAILNSCPWDNASVLDCDPGTPPGNIMELEVAGLNIGETYWLVIDGSSGVFIKWPSSYRSSGFGVLRIMHHSGQYG